MLHKRAVCYIHGLYVTYTGCMLHIQPVCNIYIRAIFYIYNVAYSGCILHIRAVFYIYGPYVTYTGCMLHIRAICYIYGLYVTYTGCMLHIRAICHIYGHQYSPLPTYEDTDLWGHCMLLIISMDFKLWEQVTNVV